MTPQQLGLVLLAASEVPNFLAGVLPSWMTIATFAADPEQTRKLRQAEVAGSALALMVGAGASMVAGSPWPLIATVVILVLMLAGYEYAIRHPISAQRDMREGTVG